MIPPVSSSDQTLRNAVRCQVPEVLTTDKIDVAHSQLQRTDVDYLLVTDAQGTPAGLITRAELDQLQENPESWSSTLCGDLVEARLPYLDPADCFDAALAVLKDHGVRPLLVLSGGKFIGVLEPTVVFQWCAQYRPSVLEELATLAARRKPPDRHTGPSTGPRTTSFH